MKKFNIIVSFIFLFLTISLIISNNLLSDIPGPHPRNRRPPIHRTDTLPAFKDSAITADTSVKKNIQPQINYENESFLQPLNLAIGGGVIILVIASFIVIVKIRNKK